MNEFLIFRQGVNATTKGDFLFDSIAAESVMAAYETHGADVMIDLEHLSLDLDSESFDPDARGWCRLQMRGDELWAVDVRWTSDGARRLSERLQRYISPAFFVDSENRITEILNIALVAMPATHQLPALVAAANKRRPSLGVGVVTLNVNTEYFNMELLKAIYKKLGLADDATPDTCMQALDALLTPAAPAEPATEAAEMAALTRLHPKHMAKVLSWKQRAETAEANAIAAKRAALIAANTDVITPGLEAWAQTIELSALEQFCSAVVRNPGVSVELPKEAPKPAPELTPEEENVVALCGLNREQVVKFKTQGLNK